MAGARLSRARLFAGVPRGRAVVRERAGRSALSTAASAHAAARAVDSLSSVDGKASTRAQEIRSDLYRAFGGRRDAARTAGVGPRDEPIPKRRVRLPVRSGRACRPAQQAGPPNVQCPPPGLLRSCYLRGGVPLRPNVANESARD